jgi:hypothetical protein
MEKSFVLHRFVTRRSDTVRHLRLSRHIAIASADHPL